MAFHLGCLRALRSEGLLDEVSTISAVSGGSVVAALYCSYPGEFDKFERVIIEVLLYSAGLGQASSSYLHHAGV